MKDSIFSRDYLGNQLKRSWLISNRDILFKNVSDFQSQFVVVTPADPRGRMAKVDFLDLTTLGLSAVEKVGIARILEYFEANKGDGKLIVIFSTKKGASFYTIL